METLNSIETEVFADGGYIITDTITGNRTVFGALAHNAYFERLRDERTYSDRPEVCVVSFCEDRGARKCELIRRRNTNQITAMEFGQWGWEVWSAARPDKVIKYFTESEARKAFRSEMLTGTNHVQEAAI